jgi:NAD(P)-dependent dehydrogenase (short-subunit alcohol dehydrogenase family)
MGTYAITGGATGIGAALKGQLRKQGEKVIVVDIQKADIHADLSTEEGRQAAVAGIQTAAPEGLDGFIPCAGLGAHVSPSSLVVKVNYFGATAVTEGVKDLVAKKRGTIVIISSNSAPMPTNNQELVEAMLSGDESQAIEIADQFDGSTAYISSKRAITQWMRRNSLVYVKQGVRMNAVAPGITETPLTDAAFEAASVAQAMKDFAESVPIGYIGKPAQIARAICFLLSPEADFVCGSVLFVDGGHDAMLRPDDF